MKLTKDGSVTKTVTRCLKLWFQGSIDELLLEARVLQYKFHNTPKNGKIDEIKQLNNFKETGKKSNATDCLTDEVSSETLSPKDTINGKTVYEMLKQKHKTPSIYHVSLNYIATESTFQTILYQRVVFKYISASAIKNAALKRHGSNGSFGLDTNESRRIFNFKKEISSETPKTVAKISFGCKLKKYLKDLLKRTTHAD